MKCLSAAVMILLGALPVVAQEPALAPVGDDSGSERSSAQREGDWSFHWNEHPELSWAGKLRVEFRARIQADGRLSQGAIDPDDDDRFDVGRRRIGTRGDIGTRIGFEIERELESTDPWRDVYITYRPFRRLELQAGKFKLPFGLEETTSSLNLDLMYRSIVSRRLAPGRDRGVMLHGRAARKIIGYEAGVFAHDGDNARPNSGSARVFGGRTYAARITAEPLRRMTSTLADLEVGFAMTQSALAEGFPAIRGRSLLGVSFFDADVWVRGSRRRTGVQARWTPGPLSISSEYIRVSDDRIGQSRDGSNLVPLLAQGWYLSGAWTFSTRRAGSIKPAARLERLAFGGAAGAGDASTSPRASQVLGNRETAMTFGVMWRPNRWIGVEGNLIREQIGGVSLASPRMQFGSRLVRLALFL